MRFAWPVIFAIAYFACAMFALRLAIGNSGIAVAWPASGVYVAALLLFGRRNRLVMTAGVAAACLGANLVSGVAVPAALAFTIVNTIDGHFAVALMGGERARNRSLTRPRNVLALGGAALASGFAGGVLAGALIGNLTVGFMLSWASTVVLGIVIVTPVILFLREDAWGRRQLHSRTGLWFVLLTASICYLAFDQLALPLLFLPFLMLSLATVLFGVSGAAVALMIVAAVGTSVLIGPDTLLSRFFGSIEEQVLFFQLYLVMLLTSALPVALLVAQRDEALRGLTVARARAESEAEQAQVIANTDVLTGIANRRRILADLATELARAEDDGTELSVAMIDIDHFKRINDNHGHDMGDHVLRMLAAMMRRSLAEGEKVGRIGGEEFLVVIPGFVAEDLVDRYQQMRERLAAVVWPSDGPAQVTLSIGIAQWQAGFDEAKLLRTADAALYRAKSEGRDRCVIERGEPA